jgi:hypothetical protein
MRCNCATSGNIGAASVASAFLRAVATNATPSNRKICLAIAGSGVAQIDTKFDRYILIVYGRLRDIARSDCALLMLTQLVERDQYLTDLILGFLIHAAFVKAAKQRGIFGT